MLYDLNIVDATVCSGPFKTLFRFVSDFLMGKFREVIELYRPKLPTVFDKATELFPDVEDVN